MTEGNSNNPKKYEKHCQKQGTQISEKAETFMVREYARTDVFRYKKFVSWTQMQQINSKVAQMVLKKRNREKNDLVYWSTYAKKVYAAIREKRGSVSNLCKEAFVGK